MVRIAEVVVEPMPTDFWRQLNQIGVNDAVAALPRGLRDWRRTLIEHPWSYNSLAFYRDLLGEEGLALGVIEDNPPMEALRFGADGREEELAFVADMIRNMGRLGIPTWCYNWAAGVGWVRTSVAKRGRGGALVSGYDHDSIDHDDLTVYGRLTADEAWANLGWFLERILPIAEDAGVRIALHPDDPPVLPEIRGIARIVTTPEAYDRVFDAYPSEANAMTLCQGNFTLMTDDLPAVIRRYGSERKIAFAHFRDVRGSAEHFVETFHDEGQTDMFACMQAYVDVGFDGLMRSDHVPLLAADTQSVPGYSDQGRLYAVGYMTGLREAAMAGKELL
jgi:mannonate dehydratase